MKTLLIVSLLLCVISTQAASDPERTLRYEEKQYYLFLERLKRSSIYDTKTAERKGKWMLKYTQPRVSVSACAAQSNNACVDSEQQAAREQLRKRIEYTLASLPDPFAKLWSMSSEEKTENIQAYAVRNTPILHLKLTRIQTGDAFMLEQVIRRQSKLKGIVLDLRENAGGSLTEAYKISDLFVRSGILGTRKDAQGKREKYLATRKNIRSESLPIVVLMDSDTCSAAEILIWALHDNGRIHGSVGTTTCGKGVYQNVYPVSDIGYVHVTAGWLFRPNGKRYHGLGFMPMIRSTVEENGMGDAMAVALDFIVPKNKALSFR